MQLEKLQFNGIDNKLTSLLARQEKLQSRMYTLESCIDNLTQQLNKLSEDLHTQDMRFRAELLQHAEKLTSLEHTKQDSEHMYTYDEMKEIVCMIMTEQLQNPNGIMYNLIYDLVKSIVYSAFNKY